MATETSPDTARIIHAIDRARNAMPSYTGLWVLLVGGMTIQALERIADRLEIIIALLQATP